MNSMSHELNQSPEQDQFNTSHRYNQFNESWTQWITNSISRLNKTNLMSHIDITNSMSHELDEPRTQSVVWIRPTHYVILPIQFHESRTQWVTNSMNLLNKSNSWRHTYQADQLNEPSRNNQFAESRTQWVTNLMSCLNKTNSLRHIFQANLTWIHDSKSWAQTLQQTATDCNRLQQTATDCNGLQRTATDYILMSHVKLISESCHTPRGPKTREDESKR